jgi:hypothetical protein
MSDFTDDNPHGNQKRLGPLPVPQPTLRTDDPGGGRNHHRFWHSSVHPRSKQH